MTTSNLPKEIEFEEGRKLTAYRDTRGDWTVGVGHTPATAGEVWTNDETNVTLASDIAAAGSGLDRDQPWWRSLDDVRQDALVNMAFNMGEHTLDEFTTFLGLMREGNYAAAADDLMTTLWDKQVPNRAARIAAQIRTGISSYE